MELRESSSDSEEKVQVKREPREEDIKGYAEHTMNELLAIYGYEKVDEGVTKELRLHHFSDKDAEREAEASNGNLVIKQESEDETTYGPQPQFSDDQINDYHIGDHNPGNSTSQADNLLNSSSGVIMGACTSDELCDGNNQPHPKYEIVCAWCQNFGYKRYTLNTATESKAFCSEKCFAACRRAYFRRNKVCDWCRHIRHTKGYIDFQNGDRKLQFCSEKCLHQYKMEVFCQETQALGSSGQPSVDAGPVKEATNRGNEQPISGAGSSSDETEQGDGMLLSVSADSSTQSFVVGNGVHHLTAKQGSDWPVLAARTHPKAKQHPNRTIIGVQHVPIAPKISAANIQRQAGGKVVITQAVVSPSITPPNVTPANALQPRISPANTHQVFGMQTAILQPAIMPTQVVGRTPVVVRGTHWPPVVRHIPGYVVPNQNHSQQPLSPIIQPQHFPPAASTKKQSEVMLSGAKKTSETLPPQSSHPPETKATNSNQSSILNQILPPVTVMVPQPIFIPVPYPIPIPVPVPEATFHAMRASLAENSTSTLDANSSIDTDRNNPVSTSNPHCYDSSSNLEIGRNLSSVFQDSVFHKQTDSEQVLGSPLGTSHKRQHAGSSHHRDPMKYSKKELTLCPESTHNSWQPFAQYNTLQRSSSMDLSLARSSEDVPYKTVQKASPLHPDINIRENVSGQQNTYLTSDATAHLSGESSAKVRQALRCHLTRRVSQSALNLTEVGRLPNPQDELRRCQSLSRLRTLESTHMAKLPELTDGCSLPRQCSTTQRSNPTDFREDLEEEDNLVISLVEEPQTPESDDSTEPERKRKCLNHV